VTHGYISCTACKPLFRNHDSDGSFERWGQGEDVRLINNPASWGSATPKYRLLGFSKGDTQNKAMDAAKKGRVPFESIPFKGMRKRLCWLFRGLGLRELHDKPDQLFLPSEPDVQSGSIIKCSISARLPDGRYSYKLKDILDADGPSGGKVQQILQTCVERHLSDEPRGRSFILLGLNKDFVAWCKSAFEKLYGPLRQAKPTIYRNADLSWVHVAHPSSSQTDPQYRRWCEGATPTAKVVWTRDELADRRAEFD
jgi:hypothetical protein